VGLIGLYIGLRQDFAVVPSAAGVLALWAHPLILTKAFDARFYGPWLAAIIWFAYLFRQALRGQASRLTFTLLGATAVVVCTIHYFGIITLLLVAGTEWLLSRSRWGALRRPIYVVALGPLALLVCVPWFLLSQKVALTAPTWIELPALGDLLAFVRSVLLPYHLGAIVIAGAISSALARFLDRGEAPPLETPNTWGILGVCLLVPFLIIFSYLVQPVTEPRYALPAIAALAPMAAFAVSRMSRFWGVGLCVFMVLVSGSDLRTEARRVTLVDQDTDALIQWLRAETAVDKNVPIIFESNHESFVVNRYAPDLAPHSFYLDYELDQLEVGKVIRLHDRDMARVYARVYNNPRLLNWEAVQDFPRVILVKGVVYGNRISHEPFVEREINGRISELVNPRYAATGSADSVVLSAFQRPPTGRASTLR
jgi:hypothetical protein